MSHLPSDHERLTPWPDLSALKRDPNPQPLTPGQQKILDAVPLRQPGPFDVFQSWPCRDQKTAVMDELIANGMPFATMASTTSTTTPASTGTSEQMLAAIKKLLADIPPEPIGEWMRGQGFPPETSLAILPETMRGLLPPFAWPQYVRFSLDVSEPTLMREVPGGWTTARYRK